MPLGKLGNTIVYAPSSFWDASKEDRDRVTNGCGPAGWKIGLISDNIWFLSIVDACNIHDWMYEYAEYTEEAKQTADKVFRDNIVRIVNAKTKWNWLRKLRYKSAQAYYILVICFGGPFFWKGKKV